MMLIVEAECAQKTELSYIEGWLNGFRFKTMMGTGSTITILAIDEMKKMKSSSQENDSGGETRNMVNFSIPWDMCSVNYNWETSLCRKRSF